MLDELAFLIKGYDGITDRRNKFIWLCRMFEVCKERPVRYQGRKVSAQFLHANFIIRLSHFNMEDLVEDVNKVLGSLRELDEQLYYFVLVATYRLPDQCLIESLQNFSLQKWKASFDFGDSCRDITPEFGTIPRLPWDITPALDATIAVPDITKEDPIEPSEICPLDPRGMISKQYAELLASDILRLAEAESRRGVSFRILVFDRGPAMLAIRDLFSGISSDLFQERDGVFCLTEYFKIETWTIIFARALMGYLVDLANRIKTLQLSLANARDDLTEDDKLYEVITTAVEDVRYMLRTHITGILTNSDQYLLDDVINVIEAHTEFLGVCLHILETKSIEITPLIYTVRCIRDSTLCPFAQKSYEVVLKGLIRLTAMTVCIFVNTGRCDFADRVFVEAQSTKMSPDRIGYGEIWESNFSVGFPSSPDLNPRLCREVVKQGVLVRLLRTDIATVSGEYVDLLKLYNIEDSQMVVDLYDEQKKVSSHVEGVLKEPITVSTLENLIEWIVGSSNMFQVCCLVASAILRDVRSMCDVIRHLLLCAGDGEFNTDECKLAHFYKLRSELEAQRFDRRHISAIKFDREYGTTRLLITPPEPLSIIITPGHARRYIRIYTFLADLTRAVSALEKVDLREPRISVDSSRLLFYYCSSMLRLVAGTRDHVLTEVDAVWQLFREDLERMKTIDLAIDAHRRAMKNMMQRTLLDMSNLTTGRTLGVVCESCVRFAQAMNSGDDASAFIHYRTFDEHAQLLREKLSVERTNMSARMLLWRIGSSGYVIEEDEERQEESTLRPSRSILTEFGFQ
uniref:Spc97 Spc98 domain containing protein n=1 Tax=Haemonchus contortus TaxID=6289 RepID=W6NSW0_HAECO